jgi:hypothetical protein
VNKFYSEGMKIYRRKVAEKYESNILDELRTGLKRVRRKIIEKDESNILVELCILRKSDGFERKERKRDNMNNVSKVTRSYLS